MGWTNIFHCEWNPFGQRVLQHYWPNAISYHDITTTDFFVHRGSIDILTGGFPCQPYSQAGKRLGKDDARHLWPHMLRAIREIQPTYVVGENVSGLLTWNEGLVFDEVQSELEVEGYEVQSFVLPACAVGAPHRRDRVWIVAAHTYRNGLDFGNGEYEEHSGEGRINALDDTIAPDARYAPGKQRERECFKDEIQKQSWRSHSRRVPANFDHFPTVTPICGGDDGLPRELDGITFSKWRTESVKAYGNAIVPQVAYQIFKAIGQTKGTQ